ncbi:MAG: hypothetical protein KC668_03575 [Myxococcales bacterium]|nr:hypothetical protein [Myxococcales bacterium]
MRALCADGNYSRITIEASCFRKQHPHETYAEHLCLVFEGVRSALQDGDTAEALRLLSRSVRVRGLLDGCAAYRGLCDALFDVLDQLGVDATATEMREFAEAQSRILAALGG